MYDYKKLTTRAHPDNDFLGGAACHHVGVVPAVGLQHDNQQEVALVWVGLALLAHVVGRRLAEVQPPHRDLVHLVRRQVHPKHRKHASTH